MVTREHSRTEAPRAERAALSAGALESTRRFAALLGEKGIRHELDVWGYDVPHDWPAWRAQIAHHLPRFV